jgi:hypothetical protein
MPWLSTCAVFLFNPPLIICCYCWCSRQLALRQDSGFTFCSSNGTFAFFWRQVHQQRSLVQDLDASQSIVVREYFVIVAKAGKHESCCWVES